MYMFGNLASNVRVLMKLLLVCLAQIQNEFTSTRSICQFIYAMVIFYYWQEVLPTGFVSLYTKKDL